MAFQFLLLTTVEDLPFLSETNQYLVQNSRPQR